MTGLVAIVRAIVVSVGAGIVLLIGACVIYAFGAGYFSHFSVPTPLNFVVAPVLLISLVVVVCRFVARWI